MSPLGAIRPEILADETRPFLCCWEHATTNFRFLCISSHSPSQAKSIPHSAIRLLGGVLWNRHPILDWCDRNKRLLFVWSKITPARSTSQHCERSNCAYCCVSLMLRERTTPFFDKVHQMLKRHVQNTVMLARNFQQPKKGLRMRFGQANIAEIATQQVSRHDTLSQTGAAQ
jgi:hypothetical protein